MKKRIGMLGLNELCCSYKFIVSLIKNDTSFFISM